MQQGEKCRASVVSCIDFRIQETLDKFLTENGLLDNCDRIELAGSVKDSAEVISQLEISHRLHGIDEVWLFQHEDCGAYSLNEEVDSDEEIAILKKDLLEIEKKIIEKIDNGISVKKFFITLSGKVMLINE